MSYVPWEDARKFNLNDLTEEQDDKFVRALAYLALGGSLDPFEFAGLEDWREVKRSPEIADRYVSDQMASDISFQMNTTCRIASIRIVNERIKFNARAYFARHAEHLARVERLGRV